MYDIFYYILAIIGIIISGFSQIMLKKAALKEYSSWLRQYINPLVIFAYVIFVIAMLLSSIAYKVVPLSLGPIWAAAKLLIATLLSYLFFKDKPNKRKVIGLAIIAIGMIGFVLF